MTITTSTEVQERTLTLHEDGRETLRRMAMHAQRIAAWFGPTSKEGVEALTSFARITESLLGWTPEHVYRDGPLSLYCNAGGMAFGLFFHANHNKCTVDGCPMYRHHDTGNLYHYGLTADVKVQLHKHEWAFAPNAPQPGSWSFHS